MAELLQQYMLETFSLPWQGSEERLRADGFGAHCQVMLAVRGDEPIGFAAWRGAYDLHNCVSGAEVIDMYVVPACRGRAVAIALLAAVAREVARTGGKYIRGSSVETRAIERMYARFARCFPGADCYLGGRAFRAMAELHGRSSREMMRGLPRQEWNYEP